MKHVQILGAGCSKCKALERRLRAVSEMHGLHLEIEKVTDLDAILAHGIMMTPGLVIDGQLKSAGTVPREQQLIEWLKET